LKGLLAPGPNCAALALRWVKRLEMGDTIFN
jgi:hypothetical protein